MNAHPMPADSPKAPNSSSKSLSAISRFGREYFGLLWDFPAHAWRIFVAHLKRPGFGSDLFLVKDGIYAKEIQL